MAVEAFVRLDTAFAVLDAMTSLTPTKPWITVVVPLYNKARTVRASLDSIARQSFNNFEALIVDDGSTDASGYIASRFRDDRFRLFTQKNAGPGAARNRAIAEARGKWLAFLDADDEWMPDYLERASRHLQAEPELGALSFAWFDQPAGSSSAPVFERRGLRNGVQSVSPSMSAARLSDMVIFMCPPSTMARTDAARKLGGFYEHGSCYGEDGHLWIKMLLNEPVRFVLEPAVHVHRDASELSGNRRSVRPVEPFLQDPEDVRKVCPAELRGLLERFLCVRAFKTSCTLSYWGHWREGAALRRRFSHPRGWREPLSLVSRLATTPVGSWAGRLDRWRKRG